ncbi:MAG: extracellular solute-binding protein [Actinomycetota bacterium]|nr:extracellular solute-binding protein [Actinomycetota bacterium]
MSLLLLAAGAIAGCDSAARPQPKPSPTTAGPTELTFGVWGKSREIEAYQSVVDTYNESASGVQVSIKAWPDAEALADAVLADEDPPDVFLLSRVDLERVTEAGLNKPLLELVDERGVDFGDGYSREALLAFSAADDQQCMPYGISPMVIFYNKELIDFERMAERGLPAPTPLETEDENPEETSGAGTDEETQPEPTYAAWTFDELRAAAEFASRPRRETKGIHVEPSLRGLAPFVFAGGGELFDDDVEPTSLAFSSDETRDALTPTLELLRDPALTLTQEQLAEQPAIEWFKHGQLGMMAGFRSMVPELRGVSGLNFDVMPMPTMDDRATIGDVTGLCISARPAAIIPQAADFLVYVASAEAVARVATAGYLVPANLQVAASEDFLQTDQRPVTSQTFNTSVPDMRLMPLIDSFRDLEAAVRGPLRQLLTMPVLDAEALTTQIDEESRPILDPESESPDPDEFDSDEFDSDE